MDEKLKSIQKKPEFSGKNIKKVTRLSGIWLMTETIVETIKADLLSIKKDTTLRMSTRSNEVRTNKLLMMKKAIYEILKNITQTKTLLNKLRHHHNLSYENLNIVKVSRDYIVFGD